MIIVFRRLALEITIYGVRNVDKVENIFARRNAAQQLQSLVWKTERCLFHIDGDIISLIIFMRRIESLLPRVRLKLLLQSPGFYVDRFN